MIQVSKHANLIYECIMYYIYAYQLRCPKQDVLRTQPKIIRRTSDLSGNKPFVVHDVQRLREEVALNIITFLFLEVVKL